MDAAPQAASFRDPAGRLAVLKDRVLRWVRPAGRDGLDAFLDSRAAAAAMADGRIVATRTLDAVQAQEALDGLGWGAVDGGVVLEHDRVPFASYPYEWAPEMLEAAGALTLDLHEALVDEGLGLKDATPYNVLFDGPRPVFIDVLSVERRDPHDPVWTPYGQFIRTFLLPLLAQRDRGIDLAMALTAHRDGLQPEAVYRLTPPLKRLAPGYLSLVTLPTWLAGKAEAQGEALYEPKRLANAEQARFVVHAAAKRLRRHLRRFAPSAEATSHWAGYMANRGHYDDEDAQRKERFVQEALVSQDPEWVLDVGCNTGHFSRMAARAGARVVAVDLDPVSVGRVWRSARADDLDILPLVVNLSRPTPSVGWRNAEFPSFLERARGRFDMVLFLAVMHHLHVTERIPLEEVVDVAADMSRGHVVFEYVGPDDPMFRVLVRGRGHLHADLSPESFEAAALRRFEIVSRLPLENADRILYLLRRKGLAAPEPVPHASAAPAPRQDLAEAPDA